MGVPLSLLLMALDLWLVLLKEKEDNTSSQPQLLVYKSVTSELVKCDEHRAAPLKTPLKKVLLPRLLAVLRAFSLQP